VNVELVRFRAVRGSGQALLASTMCNRRHRPGPVWSSPGQALLVSWRGRFMDWPLIGHVPPVLIVPIAGMPALRLLYSYMARGTAVKKCAWSCWLSRSPRPGPGIQYGLAQPKLPRLE
jgi:hypothetical protein